MKQFVKITLSDKVIQYHLNPSNTHTEVSNGELYISANHVVHMDITNESITLFLALSGMSVFDAPLDVVDLHFSKEGMGEYHRIKREILN